MDGHNNRKAGEGTDLKWGEAGSSHMGQDSTRHGNEIQWSATTQQCKKKLLARVCLVRRNLLYLRF